MIEAAEEPQTSPYKKRATTPPTTIKAADETWKVLPELACKKGTVVFLGIRAPVLYGFDAAGTTVAGTAT